MIEVTRKLARHLRAVFRRLTPRTSSPRSLVVFHSGADGMHIRLHQADVLAQFHRQGSYPTETLALPLHALADFEGAVDTAVAVEATDSGTILVRWQDGVVPQTKEYEARELDQLPALPELPDKMTPNEPGLWQALAEATRSASREGVRYATDKIQLRGGSGQMVATDGRQLLLQSGFHFPWTEDVLVPALPAYGSRELPQEEPVAVGRTDAHVALRSGAWTLYLPIDKEGRYPRAEHVLPSGNGAVRCRLDSADAVFLAKALPRLPGDDADHSPVTVDLNDQVYVRARGSGQGGTTELVLARSEAKDRPVRFSLNRMYLARAVALGLLEICVVNADTPVVFTDERRKYVIMPLGKDSTLPPAEGAVCISSAGAEGASQHSTPKRRKDVMKGPSTSDAVKGNENSQHAANDNARAESGGGGINALIAEAEFLKAMLREAYARTNQLVASLKKHKRQTHAVQATLASLRQLHQIDS